MRHFTRTEPERRLHRFYVVDVLPDLFGRTSLWLEWGRSGQSGTLRRHVYDDPGDAETAAARVIRRRLQRGYVENSLRSPYPRESRVRRGGEVAREVARPGFPLHASPPSTVRAL
jgi:predicted DNA-binding WGR domain protein